MTIHLFGVPIYEFDVAMTDLLLFTESLLFAYYLQKKSSSQTLLRRLLVILFLALGTSTVFGALFHAFFPAKATTGVGFVVWMLVAASIGVTASAVWSINGLLYKGQTFFKAILPLIALYMTVFMYVMVFVNYQYKIIILFYAPPMIILALVSLVKFLQMRFISWAGVFIGVLLSFIAATIQYLQISIHPIYFNYNALYHVIQGISLAVIFFSFRSLLGKNSQILAQKTL